MFDWKEIDTDKVTITRAGVMRSQSLIVSRQALAKASFWILASGFSQSKLDACSCDFQNDLPEILTRH
jgi:hypothetical protein